MQGLAVPALAVQALGDWAERSWFWVAVASFLLFAAIESVRPDGRVRRATLPRWLTHIALLTGNLVLGTVAVPALLVALFAGRAGPALDVFGALGGVAGPWVVLAAGLLALDLQVYWCHRLQHAVRVLWRFHAVHHSDPDMDVSTTWLHHPVANVASAVVVGGTMALLGLPLAVLSVYGLLEAGMGAVQHVATPIPDRLERWTRWLLLTPGLHAAHHSADPAYHDTNYGNLLSVFDRVFGTYRAIDATGRAALVYGLGISPARQSLAGQSVAGQSLVGALLLPFRGEHFPATLLRLGVGGDRQVSKSRLVEPGPAYPVHQPGGRAVDVGAP